MSNIKKIGEIAWKRIIQYNKEMISIMFIISF